ncbi:putative heme d1 biosynthesis radical SAM protein NirJ1 [Clostridium aminobutyricum]|uniref:Mycofactocin maturase MftC n=1 Tax=Clostridium aminobutyricum TaxID=33953 RepID=A0A939IHW0_CLOAM|nr:putative heme d1 biosynthesis radical SAM protein NirJ1 [Clostridium aminobutyricum]MBN7771943.1 putative heme d1 biosynthesis radical SAM protein NirJ1 [Clostridium aminobutyricum]
MIGVTKLLCGGEHFGDKLRYTHTASSQKNGVSTGNGPVVVWNCTRTCNLKCKHCYSNSDSRIYSGELTTQEAKRMIDNFGKFHVPVLLLSGGEPLMREDLMELIRYSQQYHIRTTISTNGTLIDKEVANNLKKNNVGYVGISIDGIGQQHDTFRGSQGSFEMAVRGIRNCLDVGQKVGLRFTISRDTVDQLEDIFHFISQEKIPRVCFYHLVYSGRGNTLMNGDISHEETRHVMDLIMRKAKELGSQTEILTVDNHADAVYMALKMKERDPKQAERILELLRMNGGNRSGIAIGSVDYQGYVHPDQFTPQHVLGNVREKDFDKIWTDTSNPIMVGLKDRKQLLKGRCGYCNWKEVCNGNFRSRAEAVTGDFWASDPACYLTNAEIGVNENAGLV